MDVHHTQILGNTYSKSRRNIEPPILWWPVRHSNHWPTENQIAGSSVVYHICCLWYTTYDDVEMNDRKFDSRQRFRNRVSEGMRGTTSTLQEHPGESIQVGRLCFSYRSRRLCSVLAIVTARLKLPSYRNGMVCSHRSHLGWSVLNLFRCLITYTSEVNHRIYSQQKVQSVISKTNSEK